MNDQAAQAADFSALPIDQQMEHILRSRLDIQELVSPFRPFPALIGSAHTLLSSSFPENHRHLGELRKLVLDSRRFEGF